MRQLLGADGDVHVHDAGQLAKEFVNGRREVIDAAGEAWRVSGEGGGGAGAFVGEGCTLGCPRRLRVADPLELALLTTVNEAVRRNNASCFVCEANGFLLATPFWVQPSPLHAEQQKIIANLARAPNRCEVFLNLLVLAKVCHRRAAISNPYF